MKGKTKTPPVLARWNVEDLTAHESNPRTISKKRFERLKLSLARIFLPHRFSLASLI